MSYQIVFVKRIGAVCFRQSDKCGFTFGSGEAKYLCGLKMHGNEVDKPPKPFLTLLIFHTSHHQIWR